MIINSHIKYPYYSFGEKARSNNTERTIVVVNVNKKYNRNVFVHEFEFADFVPVFILNAGNF